MLLPMRRLLTGAFVKSSMVRPFGRFASVALMCSVWASTGVKNPRYRDVLYVEELIGPDTVNTIPPETLESFRQHGTVRGATVLQNLAEADEQLHSLRRLGIDLDDISEKLQLDGIAVFAAAYDRVVAALEKKSHAIAAGGPGRHALERL